MTKMNKMNLFLPFALFMLLAWDFSAFAQKPCEPIWGVDSVETIQQISSYREFYKQKNHADALPSWRYVFNYAPGARKRTFVDGAAMFKTLIKGAKDKELKEKYIDTLLLIYAKRKECHGDGQAREAIEWLNHRPKEVAKIYELFDEVVDKQGNKLKHFSLYPYIIASINAHKAELIDDEKLLSIYLKTLDVIHANEKSKYAEKYKAAQKKIDEAIFKYGILTCDNITPILQKQYDANPDDQVLWEVIYSRMKALRCATEPLFIEVTEKLLAVNPDAEKVRIMAITMSNQGDYAKAMKYYKQAIELEEDKEKKAEYALSLAQLYQRNNDYPSARTYARKAASFKSGWGDPYLLIGDLYRGSGKKCGPGTGFDSQIVTWPAIDMYQKAKAVDPSVASKANKKIADSKQYMPSQTDCFMRSMNEGSSFTVGCWINETTKVRYAPE